MPAPPAGVVSRVQERGRLPLCEIFLLIEFVKLIAADNDVVVCINNAHGNALNAVLLDQPASFKAGFIDRLEWTQLVVSTPAKSVVDVQISF